MKQAAGMHRHNLAREPLTGRRAAPKTRPPLRRRVRWPYAAAVAAVVALASAAALLSGAHPGRPAVPPTLAPPPLAACTRRVPAPCYAQNPLHQAYGTGALYQRGITGKGTTIAVIVPFTDPWLHADLAAYSRYWRLPAAQVQVIAWHHPPAPPPGNAAITAWPQEGTADLELAHFMAPHARLLYVEIPATGGPNDMGTAMAALSWLAARHAASVVSFSWGLYEPQLISAGTQVLTGLRRGLQAAAAAGITVVAATGDSGPTGPVGASASRYYRSRTVTWPASDPLVTAVGGTALHLTSHGQRTSPDTVARGGQSARFPLFAPGGGLSALYPRPAYQNRVASVVGDHRGVVDVSMDAYGLVYIAAGALTGGQGWGPAEGTSLSAPLFAGIVADAAQAAGHPLGPVNPALYQMHGPADGVLDVTQGNNTDHGVPGYSAGPGYDLPSGIGTIASAALFVPALARLS